MEGTVCCEKFLAVCCIRLSPDQFENKIPKELMSSPVQSYATNVIFLMEFFIKATIVVGD